MEPKGNLVMTKINLPETAEKLPFSLVLDTKENIKKGQDAIRVTVLQLDLAIHNNALQCMMHAEKHGDTSLMRRLLVEIIDAKTGYRRQGLINWMRKFSPMELSVDNINLSGTLENGARRPFRIEEAHNTPFWTDSANAERVAKPVYQDTLLSGVNRAVKAIIDAIDNTIDGKPIDTGKPYFDGIHGSKVVDFARRVREMAEEIPQDATMIVRKAAKDREQAQRIIDEEDFKIAGTKTA